MDGGDWQLVKNVTFLEIGNAKYNGGGFMTCPEADVASGDFHVSGRAAINQ